MAANDAVLVRHIADCGTHSRLKHMTDRVKLVRCSSAAIALATSAACAKCTPRIGNVTNNRKGRERYRTARTPMSQQDRAGGLRGGTRVRKSRRTNNAWWLPNAGILERMGAGDLRCRWDVGGGEIVTALQLA